MKALSGISLASVLAFAGGSRAEDSEWLKHFRIGASAAMGISTDFKMNGKFSVSGANPGSLAAGQDHIYDDGYVRVDGTGNALGKTSFWGYQKDSQYNGLDTLTYQATTAFDTTSQSRVDDSPNLGFDMVYAGTWAHWERLSIGGEFGFNLTPFENKDRRPLTGTFTQVTDTYNTGGILLPNAPYDGNSSGVGPTINDTPATRNTTTAPGTINGNRTLEGILYNFRLGPLVRWEFYPRWTLNASGGAALGFFDAEYRFNENITVGSSTTVNTGKFSTGDMTYGGYAGAVVMYDTGNFWEAFVGAHFMSMQDVTLSRAGREAITHLGNTIYIVAGINWTF